MIRALLVLAIVLASCVPVAEEYRCGPEHDCVLDGVEGRCESTGHCSLPDTSCGTSGFRYHESAGPQAGICVLAPSPMIETVLDLKQSTDGQRSSCAPEGARDVSIELFVPMLQTVTIDTVGLEPRAPVVLSLRDGACPAGLAEVAGCRVPMCPDPGYNVLAVTLAPGAYCLVVEEVDPAAETGKVTLRILEGGREAVVIDRPMQSAPQTTCGAPIDPAPPACAPTVSAAGAAVFAVCPGTRVRATVTPDVADGLDVALSLRDGGPLGNELMSCKDEVSGTGAEMIDAVVMGPTWLIIDRVAGPVCGGYAMNHMFGP